VLSLQDVASVVRLYSLAGKLEREVAMPGLGSASGLVGRFDRPELFYAFTSPLYPTTAFLYDARANTSRPFNPPKLTFDPARFETERVFYRGKDSTRVPMFITHRRDLVKGGQNPTMLYAYGGFSISIMPSFRPDVIAWVEQGGVYAVPNIRGGGEYGEAWHQAGQFERKQNVFDDFIAAAEYLVREKYTSPAKLAINGGSNGGLLVGAAMTQRPDLFRAVVSNVPFVDVLNTMSDPSLPLTVGEFEEWGNPQNRAEYDYMKTYDPYFNVAPRAYPAMLVTTSFNDSQVMYHEPAKYVAKLRRVKTDNNPLIFVINMGAGHGGASGRYDRLREIARDYAFMLWEVGIKN
jgi:protease II